MLILEVCPGNVNMEGTNRARDDKGESRLERAERTENVPKKLIIIIMIFVQT